MTYQPRGDFPEQLLPYEKPEPPAYADYGQLAMDNVRLVRLLRQVQQLIESGRAPVAAEMLRREVGR